eukprot:6464125-Amphidinium_carterae.1
MKADLGGRQATLAVARDIVVFFAERLSAGDQQQHQHRLKVAGTCSSASLNFFVQVVQEVALLCPRLALLCAQVLLLPRLDSIPTGDQVLDRALQKVADILGAHLVRLQRLRETAVFGAILWIPWGEYHPTTVREYQCAVQEFGIRSLGTRAGKQPEQADGNDRR